jgi:hypothetical protein
VKQVSYAGVEISDGLRVMRGTAWFAKRRATNLN